MDSLLVAVFTGRSVYTLFGDICLLILVGLAYITYRHK